MIAAFASPSHPKYLDRRSSQERAYNIGKMKVYTSTLFHAQNKHKNNNKTSNNKVGVYMASSLLLSVPKTTAKQQEAVKKKQKQ